MKICIFAKGLPVHIIGGLELHTQDLADGLVSRGHKVTIITTKHPKNIRKESKKNFEIYYVGNEPLRYDKKFSVESAKLFDKIDKTENFDVIHSIQYFGSGFVKYCKSQKPLVISMHGTLKNEMKSILNERSPKILYMIPYMYLKSFTFYRPIEKPLFKKAKIIMVDSKELKRDVKEEYGIPEEKLVLVYDGIDIARFKPFNVDEFRKKLRISKDEKIIVSSGRIGKQKGYHLIIEILPELLKHFDIRLIIVGTGEYLENLKRLAKKRGVSNKVIFAGKVTDEDMPKYYNLADVFVFPTLRIEAFGIVIAEAMACGKPVIATNIGGIPSLIDDSENGFLTKLGDKKELEEKTLMVLKDNELTKKIGNNARQKVVRNFSLDKMIEDVIRVYEEVKTAMVR